MKLEGDLYSPFFKSKKVLTRRTFEDDRQEITRRRREEGYHRSD